MFPDINEEYLSGKYRLPMEQTGHRPFMRRVHSRMPNLHFRAENNRVIIYVTEIGSSGGSVSSGMGMPGFDVSLPNIVFPPALWEVAGGFLYPGGRVRYPKESGYLKERDSSRPGRLPSPPRQLRRRAGDFRRPGRGGEARRPPRPPRRRIPAFAGAPPTGGAGGSVSDIQTESRGGIPPPRLSCGTTPTGRGTGRRRTPTGRQKQARKSPARLKSGTHDSPALLTPGTPGSFRLRQDPSRGTSRPQTSYSCAESSLWEWIHCPD